MYATGAFLKVVTRHSRLVEYGGGDRTFILRATLRTQACLLTVSGLVRSGWKYSICREGTQMVPFCERLDN